MLQILNLAVGLSFIYLLLSLILTAINEIWLSFLDQRARFLTEGLREFFQEHDRPRFPGWVQCLWFKLSGKMPSSVKTVMDDVAAATAKPGNAGAGSVTPAGGSGSLLDRFYAHGLINSLSREDGGRPAYIGAEMFVTVLVDLVRKEGAAAGDDAGKQIEAGIAAIRTANPPFAQALEALYQKVAGDVAGFEKALAGWFNTSMDRVTGWYKRYTQQWLLALGLLIAVGSNVDSIHIIKALSTDPKLAKDTADQATAYAQAHQSLPADSDTQVVLSDLLSRANDTLSTLDATNVPMGWSGSQSRYFYTPEIAGKRPEKIHLGNILTAPLGWLLTAFAISLGAPFWFDTLKRFVNIRSNGLSPAEVKAKTEAATA